MARRIESRRSALSPERRVAACAALATSLEAAVERPRRIDAYIDYFASGSMQQAGIVADPCGEALLDALTSGRARWSSAP